METDPRAASAIDKRIGRNLRKMRLEASVSQEKLAEGLGITFQQVQKYESGANRVAASRLYEISRILNRPLDAFFSTPNVSRRA